MDFGDILDKWEGQSHSSAAMETWLKDNKVYNKDAAVNKTSAPGENRRRLLREKPDDILDIHCFTKEEAWLALDSFFSNAKDCGYEKLRIIHGKGNHSRGEAVLGHTVRRYIEQCPSAGESGYEKAANGGSGATWVLIKR